MLGYIQENVEIQHSYFGNCLSRTQSKFRARRCWLWIAVRQMFWPVTQKAVIVTNWRFHWDLVHDVFHCDDDLLFKSSSFGDTFCKKRSAFPSSCLVSSYLIDWSKEILGKWRWAYNDSCHNQDGLFALFTPGSWEIRRDDTSFLPSSPLFLYKDPPSSLQISVKIRYQGTKPNGRLRRSTGIAIHCEYQPNQISEPWNQGPI